MIASSKCNSDPKYQFVSIFYPRITQNENKSKKERPQTSASKFSIISKNEIFEIFFIFWGFGVFWEIIRKYAVKEVFLQNCGNLVSFRSTLCTKYKF